LLIVEAEAADYSCVKLSIVVLCDLARTSKLTQPVVPWSGNYRPPRVYSTPLLTRPSGWVIDTRRPTPSRRSLASDVRKRWFWQRFYKKIAVSVSISVTVTTLLRFTTHQ